MTIYTEDPGRGINQPIGNAPSGLGESLSSTFSQGFDEGPFMSSLRLSQSQALINDASSQMVSKAVADIKLKEYGVKSVTIPEDGVTQSYLDHVVSSRKETLAKQQIAAASPSGFIATPLNFMANLAGAMADPGNIALGFIPFIGEAKAATVLGRAGERFIQGAAMGGAQTAVTLPITAQAAAAEGDEFTLGNAMENLFFGTVAGGALHAGGGVIADMVRGRRQIAVGDIEPATVTEAQPLPAVDAPDSLPRGVDIPDSGMQSQLATAISRDVEAYAYSRAYNDVVPEYNSTLSEIQGGLRGDIADLRSEITANQKAAATLDATLAERTRQYQSESVKFRQARANAIRDIAREKQALESRNSEINQLIEGNARAEQARGEQAAISRGEIPEGLAQRIGERADDIRSGMNLNPTARAVRSAAQQVDASHWSVNQQAYRAAVAQMMDGRVPDIQPFYDLHQPALRDAAIAKIRNPQPEVDRAAAEVSSMAEQRYRDTEKADHELTAATEDLDYELGLSDAMLRDIEVNNPEATKAIREKLAAIRADAADNSMTNAYQAFAACLINRS